MLARAGFSGTLERIGVHRTYTVRHGPGPLPTEDARVSSATREPHNHDGPWQRRVRKGWLDFVLLEYALRACGGVDALALTHADALAGLESLQICGKYLETAALAVPTGIAPQAELAQLLERVTPSYLALRPGSALSELRARLESLGPPVRWASRGPTAADVTRL